MTHAEWVRAEWARIAEADADDDRARAHAIEDELVWWVVKQVAFGSEGAAEAARELHLLRDRRGRVERWYE
jgi:hypothetical protein